MKLNTRKITPALAKKLLEKNTSNRPLSPGHVDTLAAAMTRGEWQLTGESIKISSENVLLDGQHRLHAVVKSGVTIDMVVVENLPPETFHVIDTGAKVRGAADILAIAGEKDAKTLAAAAYIIGNWENDPDLSKRAVRFTIPQIEEIIKRHPDLRIYANVNSKLSRILTPSFACAFGYLFSFVDKKTSEMFMDRLATGVGLEAGNPVLFLRDLLIANKASRYKLTKQAISALVIKAFNAYHSGNYPARLRWENGEKFPLITGKKKK